MSGRRAESPRYWFNQSEGTPGYLEAAIGWFVVFFGSGALITFVMLQLSTNGILLSPLRWIPTGLFVLAAIGATINGVGHVIAGPRAEPSAPSLPR
jgi:hypothetical protein